MLFTIELEFLITEQDSKVSRLKNFYTESRILTHI